VVLGRVALLLAGEVDAHHEQALASQTRRRPRHLHARRRVDLVVGGLGRRFEEAPEARGEAGDEEPHRAQDDARAEAGLGSGHDLWLLVEGLARPTEAPVDGPNHVGHFEAGLDVSCGAKRTSR
jgi:hypothetical protein